VGMDIMKAMIALYLLIEMSLLIGLLLHMFLAVMQ